MRYTIPFVAGLAACAGPVAAQWSLFWEDTFDAGLDTDVWEAMLGTGTAYGLPAGWGNNELQYYTNLPANVAVSDGTLKITARRQSFGGRDYTSARIRTRNAVDFTWGRVEARMKIPSGSGVWPAFWMLPTDSPYGGWASSGEIDVMESVNEADRVHGTIHFGSNWPNNASNGGSVHNGGDFGDDFHVYAVEWDPNQIRWYLDGVQFHSVDASQWFSSAAPSNPRAPFDSDFHLLLNVAVGGDWPGSPNGSAEFPKTLEVDYVRVFRREQRPYQGVAGVIPGRIEAEHYDEGYPGDSFQDSDPGNNGFALRDEDVDVQVCTEGGHNVGWIRNGEWMEYTVQVQTAGTYRVSARVASPSAGGSFRIEVDGQDRTGPIAVPNTGGWQAWATTEGEIQLETGTRVIRFAKNDSSNDFNLNWFDFELHGGCPADLAEPFGALNFFDLSAYLGLFAAGDPAADLASPTGVFNFFDVSAYLAAFNAGCP
jgi:beta-glucanase (GH16 family)